MNTIKQSWFWLSLGLLLLVACTAPTPPPAGPRPLRVMVYDSFSVSESVIKAFEAQHNATVQFLKAGDTGTMLNQAILSQENPQADVIYGIDNTFLSRALEAGILQPLAARPAGLANVPPELQLDPSLRLIPVDYGDVCLNYDKAYFAEHQLPVPQDLRDLVRPEYKGLLVVENPAASSPGLAFLMATVDRFTEEHYPDFWQDLLANDVRVVDGWDTAYYNEFSGGSGSQGTRPLVVSYATSPAAEVYFSEGALTEPPTGAVTAPGTCFRQVEFTGILTGTPVADLAEAFIAFLLSDTFQADIPLQMWVFPASQTAPLPPVFQQYAIVAQEPVQLAPDVIAAHRDRWLREWTEAVLR